jgi:serine/threonine-protein kinase
VGHPRCHERGAAHQELAGHLFFWVDNYICALLAVVPAHILQQMSRKVQRARELGSYQLEERIGHGGMGEVWKARHNMLARPAAVKIIRATALGAHDSRAARATLKRFEREAQATALLQSPHTIEVFDFGLGRDGTFYYVMELLHGFDLDTFIKRFGPLPSERVASLLMQACHSLEDAHQSGLIHRDVKPANIFTCRKGQDYDFVKVLDFGLVKSERADMERGSLATMQGITTGTPGFMSPEQARSDQDLDHRADLYSLGCVGYWLLTGKLLFEAQNPVQMLLQHVQDAPIPPSQRSEVLVHAELEKVILACLEKSPASRPQSASELKEQLAHCRFDSTWDNERARTWWKKHAPEIATPAAAPPHPVGSLS